MGEEVVQLDTSVSSDQTNDTLQSNMNYLLGAMNRNLDKTTIQYAAILTSLGVIIVKLYYN